ncbi:hypothetical protein ACFE04_006905 [Oxalis oulophora]
MGCSQAMVITTSPWLSSSFNNLTVASTSSQLHSTTATPLKPSTLSLNLQTHFLKHTVNPHHVHSFNISRAKSKTRATLDENDQTAPNPVLVNEQPNREVEDSVKVLKDAAKTKKVAKEEILKAFSVIEKAKIDPSAFLNTLGGSKSPGRTWMLIFTAKKKLAGGNYIPITAVQRFDADQAPLWKHVMVVFRFAECNMHTAMRIENGVYLGPLGCLTFEGRMSWKKKILAFVFERIRIKLGPLNPLEIGLGKKEDREPSSKDPFFIWFYVDEEIAVARGRGGGTAFWVRCSRVPARRLPPLHLSGRRLPSLLFSGPNSLSFPSLDLNKTLTHK